ncbi:MAG: alpha-ketoacid dehydrogenase subunit beta [Chthonomonas sp.]|nr:alpha-ketoacid dehydrogenase subunit beta [Chthonomonas sp.]
MRKLSYGLAINEGFHQSMERDERVFVLGQGVLNPWYVGETARGLDTKYAPSGRVIDPPVSENGMNGVVIGAALAGMRPITIHPRLDFLLMGFEQVVNEASNWSYVFGGQQACPVVIRGIINRGGEQGAQHSQAIHAMFNHVPGLKVVMPATPYDAKGLLCAAVEDDNPVIYIDDRWLYSEEGNVPTEYYKTPLGKANTLKTGTDVTIVAVSYMVKLAQEASMVLAQQGINVEIVDPRTISPLDEDHIFSSVRKTGHVVVCDSGWYTGGVAGDIAARIVEKAFHALKAPILRVTLPDCPAPSATSEEKAYYPTAQHIVDKVMQVLGRQRVPQHAVTSVGQ